MASSSDSHVPQTAGELIQQVADQFAAAKLFFGHGTDNASDEAAALVFHVMRLDHAGRADQYQQLASTRELERIQHICRQRVETRQPLPYLLGEAWFAGLPFYVDPAVLIPRSPIAELIQHNFAPWLEQHEVQRILEVGTGSGCIAIACAQCFPAASVIATDISPDALAIAQRNIERYQLDGRVQLMQTDHMDGMSGSFDLIISNPPYVPVSDMAQLPPEYRHEPALALASGKDGLDSARRILQDSAQLLSPHGVLVLEVGEQWRALQDAYPRLPFHWLEFEFGGIGVALLEAAALSSKSGR